jgi:hypothetical protein
MKRMIPVAILAFAATALAVDIPVQRVADDAKVIDRVAEAAKRDLPQDLLKRILTDDIESLRGKRGDGSYDYATYERLEASRTDQSFSVQVPKNDALGHYDIKGSFAYRVIIDVPSRRMLVTKNRRVYIDHVEIEFIPMTSSATQRQTVKVEAWMEPGETKNVDFPEVARQVTARVFAKADEKAGYSNIVLTLVKARVVDNADSPYADAVATARAMVRAIDNSDIPSIRSMAARMHAGLEAKGAVAAVQTVDVIAPRTQPAPVTTPVTTPAVQSTQGGDLYQDLLSVEDLLTGSEAEKREGLDRLHQLVRRLRPH